MRILQCLARALFTTPRALGSPHLELCPPHPRTFSKAMSAASGGEDTSLSASSWPPLSTSKKT